MARAHLPPLPPRDPLPLELAPRLDDLKCIVAAVCAIEPRMFADPSRRRRYALPRQICMGLARELTPLSITRIAKSFSRDHTTVLHAARNVVRRRAIDAAFAAREAQIRETVHRLLRTGNGLRPAPGALQERLRAAVAVCRFLRAIGQARDAAGTCAITKQRFFGGAAAGIARL
jgi:hypothetical protein